MVCFWEWAILAIVVVLARATYNYKRRWSIGFVPVWPNVVVKRSPNVSKSCPKSSNSSFVHKSKVFQHYPKSCQSFGLLFLQILSPKTFKNRPIWSHWLVSCLLVFYLVHVEVANYRVETSVQIVQEIDNLEREKKTKNWSKCSRGFIPFRKSRFLIFPP